MRKLEVEQVINYKPEGWDIQDANQLQKAAVALCPTDRPIENKGKGGGNGVIGGGRNS